MERIMTNAEHLEPGMWITLWSLIIVLYPLTWLWWRSLGKTRKHQTMTQRSRQKAISEPKVPEVAQSHNSNQEDEVTDNRRTSFGQEIYHKLSGIICISIAATGRYALDFHVTDVSFSANWKYQAFLGLVVFGVWFYGVTREDKRSTDTWVNGLLILWSILLFF